MALGNLGIPCAVVRRPALLSTQGPVCLICDAHTARYPAKAKAPFTTRSVSSPSPTLFREGARRALVRTSSPSLPSVRRERYLATANDRKPAGRDGEQGDEGVPRPTGQELSSLTNMMTYIESGKAKVLTNRGIPPEADVSAALKACQVVADYIMDDSVQPQISHMASEMDSTASNLLSLDTRASERPKAAPTDDGQATGGVQITAQLKNMIDKISEAAYATIAHPTVFISPELLKQYVEVQAKLRRPETLPGVFQLYASKPLPRQAPSGTIEFAKQNPNQASNAIDPLVVETALDTAIEAKNLDAAVGIIENSYKTTAFIRSKLLRKALVPAAAFAATPLAAYILATRLSTFHDAMDPGTATNVAFVGILAYVGFTASIGFVALTTANDQMKRVTWAPGMPLRMRWIREEERAALDKVACAWGFRESWRYGEEEGAEWEALREYIGQRGMVLDRTELMEGME